VIKNLRLRLALGFVMALILSIIPMPEFITEFRPPWVLLFVLYIEYFLPGNFNQLTLLFVGLLLDVLLATVIGEHSFALLLVTWIASNKSRRFQFFSMMQQMFLIGFFCFLYQTMICLISVLLGFHYNLFTPLASAGIGIFLWPWIRLLGEDTLLTRLVYR
jgi:rod shape-determining protein MreD